MKFTPKTAEEIAAEGLFQPGTYDFEIIKAEDTISKASGNEMIALTLKVFDPEGNSTLVNDWLLEKVAYKLRHACEACGLLQKYEVGDLTADDFVRKTGRVNIIVNKDKSGQYPDRNGVKDYVPGPLSAPMPQQNRQPAIASATDLDDEIPF